VGFIAPDQPGGVSDFSLNLQNHNKQRLAHKLNPTLVTTAFKIGR
jgi:hypothetical protein